MGDVLVQPDISQTSSGSGDENSASLIPTVPSYLVGADNHQLGNDGFSLFDPGTWVDAAETKATHIGEFAVAATVSGATSFYNTGVAVANWFGADASAADNQAILSSVDDDLGQYYANNKESADLVGFIASSFIPGLGGVKVLNAAQKMLGVAREGWIGTNMARATGLLVPNVEKATALAATEIAQASTTFSAINGLSIKALAAGFGQATLESAAFETAVAATMFKAPTLDDMDFRDLAINAAVGTVVGGVIGGVITGAGILGKIKSAITKTDEVAAPFTHITELPTAASPAERIIAYSNDITSTPDLGSLDDFTQNYLSKIAGVDDSVGSAQAMYSKFQGLADTRNQKLNNLIRDNIQKLSGGDSDLGNFVADNLQGLSYDQIAQNLTHLTEIGRIGSKLPVESQLEKIGAKLGTSGAQDILDNTNAATLSKQIGYIKLAGEDAGDVSFTAPNVLNLGDTITGGIDAVKDGVAKIAKQAGWGVKSGAIQDVAQMTHTQAEARYIWTDRFASDLKPGQTIGSQDIPLLEKAYADPNFESINLQTPEGFQYSVSNKSDLLNEIKQSKLDVASTLLQGKRAGTGISTDEIAKITNMRRSYLEGDAQDDFTKDIFARQSFKSEYASSLEAKGLNPSGADTLDLKPTYMKAGYNFQPYTGLDGMMLEGMAHVKQAEKVYMTGVDNSFAKSTGELNERFWHPDESLILNANRYGAGPKFASFAGGNYHTLASWAETIGQSTASLQKYLKGNTTDQLEALAYKLSQNHDAAIEWASVNNKISATAEKYVLNDAGDTLVARSIDRYRKAVANGEKGIDYPKLQTGAAEEIPLVSDEVKDLTSAHIRVWGERTSGIKELRASQGLEDAKDATTFYPIRPDPKEYTHFAFVTDPKVTGVGHVSMIHAPDAATLEQLIRKVPDNYSTITKSQSEDWHNAIRDYDLNRTLHENYIDSDLKSQGVNSQFFTPTDPQKIATDFLQAHLKADDVYARSLVSGKFDKEFSELRRMAETTGSIDSSKYASRFDDLDTIRKNPMMSYVKTALNINQKGDIPLLTGLNNWLDSAVSRIANEVGGLFSAAKSPDDLAAVNKSLEANGMKSAYYDAALNSLVNRGPNEGVLRQFVAKSNAMLSALTIRLNPINAINNAVGSAVLLGPETKSVLRGISEGRPELAGRLSELMDTPLPGTKDSITSATKLITNSIKNYFTDMRTNGSPLISGYKANGWVTDLSSQYKSMLDDLTINGAEKATDLSSRLNTAFTKAQNLAHVGERISGNRLSEEFNRFVAADVMRQITDVGVEGGVISANEAKSYINTFINRVHGNLLASQRPLMFQGPVGQALSLFQTYQFNMIQQLLRQVGEGNGKTAAMALGLQTTIYGMNGLPAFNFINQHIVGTMSGNPQHRDLYDATYGALGKTTADWLMYGLPSNLLQTNIYAHGDMNPRQITLVPTNPADIPLVSAYGKFFGSLYDTAQNIIKGGNVWESTLQGVEHMGLMKPLAGLAQTLQATTNDQNLAYSTTTKGNILGTNDLFSIATVSRLAGGTPFDEAITKDALYRYSAYQAYDNAKTEDINKSLKTTLIGGGQPTADQVNGFAGQYAAMGGTQKNFNRTMMAQFKDANTTQANQIIAHLKSPYAQSMQTIMGGTQQMDGRNMSQNSQAAMNAGYTSSSNTQ